MTTAVRWAGALGAILASESSTAVAFAIHTLAVKVAMVGASGDLTRFSSKALATVASTIGAESSPIASVWAINE
jgi:hypothetical protein